MSGMGVPGVWTPVAEVICLTCHGEDMKWGRPGKVTGWARRDVQSAPREGEYEGVTTCQACSRDIVVRQDVARLRNFGLHVGDKLWEMPWGGWLMEQTGGMCANLSIDLPCGRMVMVGDAEDGGKLCMGLYRSREALDNGQDALADFEWEPKNNAAAIVKLVEWAAL